jgi:heme/copper-type cytochrome/quinol oxidase subunit 2
MIARRVALSLALVLATASVASACPVCAGNTDSQMAQGANNAIFFMLAIVGLVQAALVALFVSIRRRTRALNARREQFQLIEGGVR